jgi:hypothetical protein
MAVASDISDDTLAWTSQWYLRQDTTARGERPAGWRRNAVVLGTGIVIALRGRPILAGFAR